MGPKNRYNRTCFWKYIFKAPTYLSIAFHYVINTTCSSIIGVIKPNDRRLLLCFIAVIIKNIQYTLKCTNLLILKYKYRKYKDERLSDLGKKWLKQSPTEFYRLRQSLKLLQSGLLESESDPFKKFESKK